MSLLLALTGGGGVVTINASAGAYSWSGTTSTTSQTLDAIVGQYSWTGVTGTTTQVNETEVGMMRARLVKSFVPAALIPITGYQVAAVKPPTLAVAPDVAPK